MMLKLKIMFASVMTVIFDPSNCAAAFLLSPHNAPSSSAQSVQMGFSPDHWITCLGGEVFFVMANNSTKGRKKPTKNNEIPLFASTNSSPSEHNKPELNRSSFLAYFLGVPASFQMAQASFADDSPQPPDNKIIIIEGVATLKEGNVFTASQPSSAALYITARPENMKNAPKELFHAMGGRSPPVLTAKFQVENGDVFPLSFQITPDAVTPEGAFRSLSSKSLKNNQLHDESTTYWWSKDNLVVSARLDSDGVAATRDPEDLVGRSISLNDKCKSGEDETRSISCRREVLLELQGRGIGGKFVTQKHDKRTSNL